MFRIPDAVQPSLWWLIRKLVPPRDGDGLPVLDLRLGGGDAAAAVRSAMKQIRAGGAEFAGLVLQNVEFVAVGRYPRPALQLRVRGYLTPLEADECNPHYLAARLVWVAAYFRQRALRPSQSEQFSRAEGYAEQLRFAACFPDSGEWIEYLSSIREADRRYTRPA
jgi:hypothetical protein